MLKMDFLGLTTLTVIHDALAPIERRTGRTLRPRHPPARRRRDVPRCCAPGAPPASSSSSRRSPPTCCAACAATASTISSPPTRCMRPGPLDAGMHHVYMQPQARRGAGHATPLPELEAILELDVRRHHLPGAGDAHRADAGRHLARRSRRAAQGGGQEGRGADSQGARQVRREGGRARPRRRRSSRSSPGRSRRSAATASTSRTRSRTRSSRTRRRGSRRTIPPSSWPRCCRRSIGDTDSVVKYINEARELGIEVLPPDVNESGYKFTVVGDKRVRFGLGAIRNVGRTAIDSILAARADGPSRRSTISASASTSASATSASSRR